MRTAPLLMLVAVCAWTTACSAQPAAAPAGITLNPLMVKGPATAPVTVIEFSDYQ